MSKIPFRVSDGLDGADIRAINIGYPNKTSKTDAVNVEFFVDENTIQQYNPNRKYNKDFAVIYNDRTYYALRNIPTGSGAVAGPFDPVHWRLIRTDPSWINISNTPALGYPIVVGSYISADPSYSDLDFILPRGAQNGDTVVIKDVSGMVSTKRLKVTTQDKILDNGTVEYQLTLPKSTIVFSYDQTLDANKGGWRINVQHAKVNSMIISPTVNGTQMSNGDTAFRRSAAGKIKLILPLYANDGDFITLFDLDQMSSVNNLTIAVHKDSTASLFEPGAKEYISKTTGWGCAVYQASTNMWNLWDGDEFEKWIAVSSSIPAAEITLIPTNRILVTGKDGAINFKLPAAPAIGDSVVLSFRNASRDIDVNIKTASGAEKIFATPAMMKISRFNELVNFEDIIPTAELKFKTDGYGQVFKLIFNTQRGISGWTIAEQEFIPIMASSTASVRSLQGMVAFATGAEVLKNHEDNPSDETAVTPLTLAQKIALENRRGIAFLASQADTNAGVDDSKIVTPKKLHERTALEDRRGIAEIATQAETDAGTDDERIVTAKKLAGRIATEDRTGVVALVRKDGKKQSARTTTGEGINDFNDHIKVVTPKTLAEKTATETNLGLVFWATQSEVNNGAEGNFVVRPSTLAARTSTPTRTGLARMVDMTNSEHLKSITDSLDSNVFITPKALASRIATETMDGITRPALDIDITTGTDAVKYLTPAKLKYYADDVIKIRANEPDGLNITGTIWKGLDFVIDKSSEAGRGTLRIATQDEVDAGTIDDAIVTPLKLQAKKATQKVFGIARLATAAEAAAGMRDDVAITPLTMGSALNNSSEWGSTEVRRGSAYIAALTNDNAANTVWQGTDERGSTRALSNYQHDFYAVSPRGLNTALQHYLPIKAKAVDSTLFDGLKSSQVMRTDQDTKTTGTLIVDKSISTTFIGVKGAPESTVIGSYLAFNKDTINGQTDFINNKGTASGGFAFWSGKDDVDIKRVVSINATGTISAEGINTSAGARIGESLTVDSEINYKSQTLDARFVNAAGDTMTGNLKFDTDKFIEFDNNNKFDSSLRYINRASMATVGKGYVAVGATSTTAGFIELGTSNSSGTDAVHARQRNAAGSVINTFTLLDATGDSRADKTFSGNKLVARSSEEGMISWGNKGSKVNNDGDVYGSVWNNQYLSTFIQSMVDQKVDRKGDTITGNLTLNKDLIVEGSLKIKVGNKYLVIRPNAANETVSFDWE